MNSPFDPFHGDILKAARTGFSGPLRLNGAWAGWGGTRNGALLKRASGVIDAFVTMDTNLQHQQNVAVLSFGVVVINREGPEPARITARQAQQRLYRRYQRLAARGKPKQHVVTAIARELTGFVWATLTQ